MLHSNKEVRILEKIGLSNHESGVYLSLVESGPETVAGIARNAGINRPAVYKTLPTLIEKGLVSKGPRAHQQKYVAEDPDKLGMVLENTKAALEDYIPELKSIFHTLEKKPHVKYLEGPRGIRSVFDDLVASLKRGDVFYRYSSTSNLERAEKYMAKNYREIRDKKQLERFVITSERQAKSKKPRMEREIRTIPKEYDLFEYDITLLIYGNKIAYVDYNSETALIVENKIIADFQRMLFKLLYKKL